MKSPSMAQTGHWQKTVPEIKSNALKTVICMNWNKCTGCGKKEALWYLLQFSQQPFGISMQNFIHVYSSHAHITVLAAC